MTTRKHRFPLVVYGPIGCGKTANANRIAKVFGVTTVIDDWDGKSSLYRPGADTLALTRVPPPYGGRYDFITFEEAMKEVKRAAAPMGRAAMARTRADIAGRIMAALMQVEYTRFGHVTIPDVATVAVRATDALLAELERTAK